MTEELLEKIRIANIVIVEKDYWDFELKKLDMIPACYDGDFLEYQRNYFLSLSFIEVTPLRFIYQLTNKSQLFWPVLLLRSEDNTFSLETFGGGVCSPIAIQGIQEGVRSKAEAEMYNVLKKLMEFYFIKKVTVITNRRTNQLGKWYQKIAEESISALLSHNMYVALDWPMVDIFANFRKSYKNLVNKAKNLWKFEILSGEFEKLIFEKYKLLHIETSGRQTRSDESWDLQYQMILDKKAFLIALFDSNGELIGGGYFNYTRDEAFYSVGVYKRELFDQPLGHFVQFLAISFMKDLGIRQYFVGKRHYKSDIPSPEEKLLNISSFKNGFATHLDMEAHHILINIMNK
jgi:FemAB family protein